MPPREGCDRSAAPQLLQLRGPRKHPLPPVAGFCGWVTPGLCHGPGQAQLSPPEGAQRLLDLLREQSASRAAPAAPPLRSEVPRATRPPVSGQPWARRRLLGHRPLLEASPEAGLEAVPQAHVPTPGTGIELVAVARAHACQGTEQLNASRLAGNGEAAGCTTGPPGPPLSPWLLMHPRCASLSSVSGSRLRRCFACHEARLLTS